MLELFLAALEDQLGLLVNPPLAPIARMNIISLEITRLTQAKDGKPARTFIGIDHGYNGDYGAEVGGYYDGDKYVVTKTTYIKPERENHVK